jgi:hypothetical protein
MEAKAGVVLADVQQKVAEIDTMIMRGQKRLLRPGEEGDLFEFDGVKAEIDVVKYHSKQYGYVEEGYAGGSLFYRATFNLPKRQTLLVFPTYKKYVTFPSTDKQSQLLETLPPDGIVDVLVGSDYKELGRDNIEGVEAQCFEFQTIESFKNLLPKPVLHMQDFKGKIWIGIKEQLPVRLEAELSIGKSLMTHRATRRLHRNNAQRHSSVYSDGGQSRRCRFGNHPGGCCLLEKAKKKKKKNRNLSQLMRSPSPADLTWLNRKSPAQNHGAFLSECILRSARFGFS